MIDSAKIGDFVTAKLVGKDEPRQGVYWGEGANSTLLIRGETGTFKCEGKLTVVPDKTLAPETLQFITAVRADLRQQMAAADKFTP